MNRHTHPQTHSSAPVRGHQPRRDHAREREEPPMETEGGFSRILATLPMTVLLTLPVGLLLLTVSAGLAYATSDPTAAVLPFAYGALALTSLIGGVLAGLRARPRSVLAGLLCGGLWAFLLTVVAAVLPSPAPISPALPWLARLGVVALHLLGAWLTRHRPQTAAHTAPGHHASHRR